MPPGTVVLTADYAQAGALHKFAPELAAYSAHRGYAYFGVPPENTTSVLFAGSDPGELARYFGSVRPAGTTGNAYGGLKNLALDVPLWICEQPLDSWPRLWERMRHIA